MERVPFSKLGSEVKASVEKGFSRRSVDDVEVDTAMCGKTLQYMCKAIFLDSCSAPAQVASSYSIQNSINVQLLLPLPR